MGRTPQRGAATGPAVDDAGPTDLASLHRRACATFGAVARGDVSDWDVASPCADWSARDLVEHVIGFHEVLILRPLQIHAGRTRTAPDERWTKTERAIERALDDTGLDDVIGEPDGAATLRSLLPALTTDVAVHAWDLARAAGRDLVLDPDLVEASYAGIAGRTDALAASGFFAPAIEIPDDASPQARLLAALGRDPDWPAQRGDS